MLSTFGRAVSPYIGVYNKAKCADFFSKFDIKPASVAITPLNRRGKYLGTLNLGSYQADRFSDKMATDFIEHLVSVVSVCLENTVIVRTGNRSEKPCYALVGAKKGAGSVGGTDAGSGWRQRTDTALLLLPTAWDNMGESKSFSQTP